MTHRRLAARAFLVGLTVYAVVALHPAEQAEQHVADR